MALSFFDFQSLSDKASLRDGSSEYNGAFFIGGIEVRRAILG